MQGYLALVLHAHLPFVRHPEHDKFLEESWLYEAITETYIPLVELLDGWRRDGLPARLTLSFSPTLCAMLLDPLLKERYARHLDSLIELAEKEIHRTHFEPAFQELAWMYYRRFLQVRETWQACDSNLLAAFRQLQDEGWLEITTTAATHALLPLLATHPQSIRAQVLVARDSYRACFGREPHGFWLPECAYAEDVESFLQEGNLRWFALDTHGVLHAQPQPRYSVFAPIFTPRGLAAFGRDFDSSRQVWSRHEGYPGDPRYRDFYRDIGFDLDFDYVKPHLPSPEHRGFTGIKYHRITGPGAAKAVYERRAALQAASDHAAHFLAARVTQTEQLTQILDRPPLLLAPYDAELFGHWWYEGPEFLDALVRQLGSGQQTVTMITPEEYLRRHPTHQVATPSASSWGEQGYWRAWLNEANQWIYPHLHIAQDRMTQLAKDLPTLSRGRKSAEVRALRQAARELLLAQASDWPFIIHAGTSPSYARQHVEDHLARFNTLYDQLTSGRIQESWLREVESRDNLFPDINCAYWA